MLDGQTRLNLLRTIARSVVREAQAHPGEWVGLGHDLNFDEVIYEAEVFTLGFGGDYWDCTDQTEAAESLARVWRETFDYALADGEMTQEEIDKIIVECAREVGVVVYVKEAE